MTTITEKITELSAEDIGKAVHIVNGEQLLGGRLEYYEYIREKNQVSVKIKGNPTPYKISYRATISVVQDQDTIVYNRVEAEVWPHQGRFPVQVDIGGGLDINAQVDGSIDTTLKEEDYSSYLYTDKSEDKED